VINKAIIIGISTEGRFYLADRLPRKGYEIRFNSNDHEVSTSLNLEQLRIKGRHNLKSILASDFRSFLAALQKIEADEVYNLAGQTSVGMSFDYLVETFDSILIGTMNLLECLRLFRHPVKFYNAGSSEVFGNTIKPANEETPFNRRSPYAGAKAAAHYAVTNYREAYDIFACTGILFNHESPLRPDRFVTSKIVSTTLRIASGIREKLNLGKMDIRRDWGRAPDYVDAMWRMLQQPAPGDYVVATEVEHTLQDFVAEVFRLCGLDWHAHVKTDSSLFRPLDIERSCGNAAKALSELGWSPSGAFESVVQRFVDGRKGHTKV
jgi:GDPmannose 4,6-dehydratase